MAIKILVVDKTIDPAMSFIGSLGAGEFDVIFIDQTSRAISNVRKTNYSLIILGDKLADKGDAQDVAVELKNSNHNKHTPVVCIGHNKSRRTKMVGVLKPYSYAVDVGNEEEVKLVTSRIRDLFAKAAEPKV